MSGPSTCDHSSAKLVGSDDQSGVVTFVWWCPRCGALGRNGTSDELRRWMPALWRVADAPRTPPANELAYAAGLLAAIEVVDFDQAHPIVRRVRDWLCTLADVELGDGV